MALIKPQFEAGPAEVGRGGVVRDTAVHRAVCERVSAWVAAQPGWGVVGIVESPIQGPAGNREFLLYARRARERAVRTSIVPGCGHLPRSAQTRRLLVMTREKSLVPLPHGVGCHAQSGFSRSRNRRA